MHTINVSGFMSCLFACWLMLVTQVNAEGGAGMVTILYDEKNPDQGIAIMDLRNAESFDIFGPHATIKNLTARLILARRITIQEEYGGSRVRIGLVGGILDSIPYFPAAEQEDKQEVSLHIRTTYDLEPTDLVRINGKTMTARQAASSHPAIPIQQ